MNQLADILWSTEPKNPQSHKTNRCVHTCNSYVTSVLYVLHVCVHICILTLKYQKSEPFAACSLAAAVEKRGPSLRRRLGVCARCWAHGRRAEEPPRAGGDGDPRPQRSEPGDRLVTSPPGPVALRTGLAASPAGRAWAGHPCRGLASRSFLRPARGSRGTRHCCRA